MENSYTSTYSFLQETLKTGNQESFLKKSEEALSLLEKLDSDYCPFEMEKKLQIKFSYLLSYIHQQGEQKRKFQMELKNTFIETIDKSQWISKTEGENLTGINRRTIANHKASMVEGRYGVQVRSFAAWLEKYRGGIFYPVFEENWKNRVN